MVLLHRFALYSVALLFSFASFSLYAGPAADQPSVVFSPIRISVGAREAAVREAIAREAAVRREQEAARHNFDLQKEKLKEAILVFQKARYAFDAATAPIGCDYGDLLEEIQQIDTSCHGFDLDTHEGKISFLAWFITRKELIQTGGKVVEQYIRTLRARPNDGSREYIEDQECANELRETLYVNLKQTFTYGNDLIRLGWLSFLSEPPKEMYPSPVRVKPVARFT